MSRQAKPAPIAMPTVAEDRAITAAAKADPDAQPLTSKQLKAMVPMRSVRGRPPLANKKQLVSIRYSPEVLEYFKGTGEGWQSRIDGVLQAYVAKQARRATHMRADTVGTGMNRIDHDTEQAVRRFLDGLADQYDIVGAIVYGSRARGRHRPDSDADVAVLLRGERRDFLSVKLDMADVAFDSLLETGILVSPLPVWLDEWDHPEDYPNPALLHNIAREGVRL